MFQRKYNMIVDPIRNFVFTIFAGFLTNVLVMVGLAMLYEKYIYEHMTYSLTLVPVIALFACLSVLVLVLIFGIAVDLVDKGCLAWNRDSLGYLL